MPLWNDRTPISEDARDALGSLARVTPPDEGVSRERAEAVLTEEHDPVTANALLEQLSNRGYIYAVDDTVFITDRDDVD